MSAFEGSEVFRTVLTGPDGIFPPAMNNPAWLPDEPVWVSVGWGQPLGCSWAASRALSAGGRWKSWRAAASAWNSGDALYRETCFSATGAWKLGTAITAGASLAYYQVAIRDIEDLEGELRLGAALSAPLSERLEVALWYHGLALEREQAYTGMVRQLFQLAVMSRLGEDNTWTLAMEKTPGYSLRQLAEIDLTGWRHIRLQLGYRTAPGMPYLGAQAPIGRISVSVRMNYHSIFGLSTAFGFTFR